ncbi:MAG: nicotinate-nucleotide diphosphorylase (carboxylating), partial [Acidobacteriota bacterium]|nr:nicotinate-nucleotide diphosphorylase (carboxylating) [Acidobacteriota bacterium]
MTEEMEPAVYRKLVQRALKEDLGTGDITSEAVVETTSWAKGRILSKSTCILAGLEVVTEVFRQVDSRIRLTCQRSDGDSCGAGEVVVNLSGAARSILAGERTALNFLQRLSGIATLTRAFVDASA